MWLRLRNVKKERKKVCPFLLLENSKSPSPQGPPDFLTTCLGIYSLTVKVYIFFYMGFHGGGEGRMKKQGRIVILGSLIWQLWIRGVCVCVCVCVLSCLSCLTLCNPMDYSLPGSSVHGDSPGKNTGVGCHALLLGIFPTQELNLHFLCLLHWLVGLYH